MKLLEINKIKIISDYEGGQSVASLAREYDVNPWSIKNLLIKNDVKTRTPADLKIKFDEDFFFANTPETYYFWGFMLGDGCLIQHKQGHRYITITLKENDECVLQQFCEWLSMDKIHIKHGVSNSKTQWSRLEVYGTFFKQDFSKFGLVPNKTYEPVLPQLESKLVKPFILGLIDADGSVAWHKSMTNNKFPHRKQQHEYSLQLVGHPIIMDWVKQQLRIIGYTGNINEQIVKNKWKRIRIQKKKDIIDLANCLNLKEYHQLCLPRKWHALYQNISIT